MKILKKITKTNPLDVIIKKATATETVLVLVNSRATVQSFTVPTALQGNWTNAKTGVGVTVSSNMAINSFQYLILKK
ncbi:MAG: hypothetical protein H7339_17405 [Arcicella sp.]|nr:hypothetical protein [Arcicella sp.]